MFAISAAAVFAASAMVASALPFSITQRAGSYDSTFNVVLTPTNLGACDHVTVAWIGDDNGFAPWTLDIGVGGFYDANGLEIIQTASNLCEDTFSWTVTNPPGTSMFFRVTSFDGKISYTQNHVVRDTGFCPSASEPSAVATNDAWIQEPTGPTAMATETVTDGASCTETETVTEASEEPAATPETTAAVVTADGSEGSIDDHFASPSPASENDGEVASDENTATVDDTAAAEYNNGDTAAVVSWE